MGTSKVFKMLVSAMAIAVIFCVGCNDGGNTVTPPAEHTLKIYLNPVNGGSVDCKPSKTTYKTGDVVTVTAVAAVGYKFVK